MEFEPKPNSLQTHLVRKNRGAVLLWVVFILIILGLLVVFGVIGFSGDPVITINTNPAEAVSTETDTTPTTSSAPAANPQLPPPAPAPASAVNTNTLPEG